jgi:large subunit ribosomal protein L24
MKTLIHKNDIVQALSGRDRGKTGKVLRVLPEKGKVVVEGVNFRKKAMRRSQNNPKGGILEIERPMHLSTVGIVCPKCEKPVRVAMKDNEQRGKIRTCRKCGEALEVKQ